MWVNQSVNWLTASWFVNELSSYCVQYKSYIDVTGRYHEMCLCLFLLWNYNFKLFIFSQKRWKMLFCKVKMPFMNFCALQFVAWMFINGAKRTSPTTVALTQRTWQPFSISSEYRATNWMRQSVKKSVLRCLETFLITCASEVMTLWRFTNMLIIIIIIINCMLLLIQSFIIHMLFLPHIVRHIFGNEICI